MSACVKCAKEFLVSEAEIKYYERVGVDVPMMCQLCRQQRRIAFRNERTLYPRVCGLCKKQTVSIYSPEPPAGREQYPIAVYCQDCWWGDAWDPMSFGVSYDPARPFFEQYLALQSRVPRVAITNTNSVNSEYTNYTANNKNCYLVFSNSYGHNEDCYYGTMLAKNKSCVDTIQIEECELCYNCVDCNKCYRLIKCQMCVNCVDSAFLEDCRNCSNCFMCKGLRNKQYCILNKQYTKDEYEREVSKYAIHTASGYVRAERKFDDFRIDLPSRFSYQINAENSTGDYITASSNCKECFDTTESEDCAYNQYSVNHNKDVQDCSYSGGCELGFNNLSYVGGYHCIGCNIIWWNVAELTYSELCFNNARDCFGCIGLRAKQYCILNKQYTEVEYKNLKEKIINDLRRRKEWGGFFPPALSPFGYNESVAQDYFPLSREEVTKLGYPWNEKVPGSFGKGSMTMDKLSDDIGDVTDEILKQMLTCNTCQRNFTIIKSELEFYRKMHIPSPRHCFDCRHRERLERRRPRELWHRQCVCKLQHDWHAGKECANEFETSYAPSRPEKVFCEACYQKEVV